MQTAPTPLPPTLAISTKQFSNMTSQDFLPYSGASRRKLTRFVASIVYGGVEIIVLHTRLRLLVKTCTATLPSTWQ